ncbi:MAG: 16S rRNA (cytosine(1402)-N(4))-methyltransferase RsmH [Clostridiales bacterium]|nr:16S rRNA (cytosine(1402)-N(4))-methyltransferase RsmH [Clostridiales bacterium]
MSYHVPVLYNECLDNLNIKAGGTYFDGTLGGAGHSEGILMRGGNLIATDLDKDAIENAKLRLNKPEYAGRFNLVRDNYKNFSNVIESLGVDKIDGALLDLGISSHQIDEPERGFSYRFDGKLDMRMSDEQPLSAYDVVNTYSEEKLADILYLYAEERFSRRIARNIVNARKNKPIETTLQLAEIVKQSVPMQAQKNGHPAKKTFQAIRIEVNGELNGLDTVIEDIIAKLNSGARLCIITFHSLEDRIVKKAFALHSTDCICDKKLPICICGHKATVKSLGKIKPSKEELELNSRSASATLRIIEKL